MKVPIEHKATASFWKHYDALPKSVRAVADKNYQLLRNDPYHPSLHFKNVRGEIWSARIGSDHRAIAIPHGGGFAWIWIGSHKEYDRAIK